MGGHHLFLDYTHPRLLSACPSRPPSHRPHATFATTDCKTHTQTPGKPNRAILCCSKGNVLNPAPLREPRGPRNELHDGSVGLTVALFSTREIDINQGAPDVSTSLMYAPTFGHSRVVGALLDRGPTLQV